MIINKDCPKDNLGCVAGHLFLYEQGKIKGFDNLSHEMLQNCGRGYSSETLKLFLQYFENMHLLTSVISAFVYAASKQFSTPETAAEYLQRYRNEFKNAIKSSFNNELTSYQSLVDENLNDSREEMKLFQESFHLLCKSFIGSQVPTGQEFIKDITFKYADNKQITWSNCNEAAFINWLLGTAYNPENQKFEPEKVTTNATLKDSLSKTNGFDSIFNQSAASGALQNLPFVICRQIKIGEHKFIYYEGVNQGVVLVPHEFYEKLEFKEEFLRNETNNPDDPKNIEQNSKYLCKDGTSGEHSLGGKYDGTIYFIDQSAYPDAFSFDLDSSPINFLILCYHLGFPSLREKFQSAQEIFEIAMKPTDEIYKVLQDSFSKYDCKVTRKLNHVLLQFPFGFFDIPSRHSILGFKEKIITLKTSELLEKDNLLRIILSEEDIFEDRFEKLIWALVKKKVPKNLQIDYDSMRMSFEKFFDKIGFPDKENFIVDLIIKDPTFLNEIQKGSIGDGIFWEIGKYFDEQGTIIFSRLPKEITERSILLKLMETIFEKFNAIWTEKFYHPSTRNQGLLKTYGGLFFSSGRNPTKAKEFVLNDLATNYQSFERDALVNMILEICSHAAMKDFESILYYKKMITYAIKRNDEKEIEECKKGLADAMDNDETIQILGKFPFLTKEYLKGFSYSFSTPGEQSKSKNYERIVSPSFYAVFALKYDLSFEFIKEIGDEPFSQEYGKYFKDLEIEQEKWNQLKKDYGNFEFFKGLESLIKVQKESEEKKTKVIDEESFETAESSPPESDEESFQTAESSPPEST